MKPQVQYVEQFLIETIEAELARQETRRELREETQRDSGVDLGPALHYMDGLIDGLRYARNVVDSVAKGEKV